MLKDIKETACPDCGCSKIVSERFERRHCNGHCNEYREFDCGARLYFSPNFMSTSLDSQCQKNDSFLKERELRKSAIAKVEKYINRMTVNDKFKEMILSKFDYINYDI